MSRVAFEGLVLVETADALTAVAGLTCLERLRRTLESLGARRVRIRLVDDLDRSRVERSQRRPIDPADVSAGAVDCRSLAVDGGAADLAGHRLLIVSADRIIDPRALEALLDATAGAVLVGHAPTQCGAAVCSREWLSAQPEGTSFAAAVSRGLESGTLAAVDIDSLPEYSRSLRRRFPPFWFAAPRGAAEAARAEARLLDSAQKGALDVPAYVHAPIEKFLTRLVAPTRITPNQITLVTSLAAWTATLMFLAGRLEVGLAVALLVGVLDGVDGKLARVRLETSKLGEAEHVLDFLFEWSWWSALAYHLSSSGLLPSAWALWGVLAVSELAGGLAKLAVQRRFGRIIDEVSRLDRVVRLVAGRRNIYVWILTAAVLAGTPEAGYRWVAGWALASALFYLARAPVLLFGSRSTRETLPTAVATKP